MKYKMILVFKACCFFTLYVFSHQAKGALWNQYNDEMLNSTDRRLLGSRCNIFKGKWVFDYASKPLYNYNTCPFIDGEFNCQKYKRPDTDYLKYRWQPFTCNQLPSFNGKYFLEKWRGKKIMFVGDSLSLNMWQSLSCMIHASVPNTKTKLVPRLNLTFVEFNVQLLLYRTPYLVDMVKGNGGGRILKLDSIRGGDAWKGMDMLIFNSWHWWTHTGRSQPWKYIQEGNKWYKDMNRMLAYYKGLTTWARWINRNVDPSRTKVFFQGVSPTHYMSSEWDDAPTKSCSGETLPFSGLRYPTAEPLGSNVIKRVLSRIKKPVYLLDITALSQYRKDAHPTNYSDRNVLDCSHWCLPGLPDTWNQLLYAALFS